MAINSIQFNGTKLKQQYNKSTQTKKEKKRN